METHLNSILSSLYLKDEVIKVTCEFFKSAFNKYQKEESDMRSSLRSKLRHEKEMHDKKVKSEIFLLN